MLYAFVNYVISFNALTVQCPDYYYYFIHLFKSSKIKFNQSSKRSDMTEDRFLISKDFDARFPHVSLLE